MKWFSFVAGMLLAMLVATPIYAQQPGTSTDPSHPAALVTAATTAEPAPAPGSTGAGMPMMDMCRQMMGGGMSMPMMGAGMGMPMMGGGMSMPMMGAGAAADPKAKAEMLQMHGEMMKAMGDIMMKHARHMQGPTPK
jgi:hypothetical protein